MSGACRVLVGIFYVLFNSMIKLSTFTLGLFLLNLDRFLQMIAQKLNTSKMLFAKRLEHLGDTTFLLFHIWMDIKIESGTDI